MGRDSMGSKELGLVLAQQLLGADDLHYGLWDPPLELKLSNVPIAQERYTGLLLSALPPAAPGPVRVLDVGCGTGKLIARLLELGYRADGVIPSPCLARLAQQRLERCPGSATRIFECRFEDLPAEAVRAGYDVVLFGESLQYIELEAALRLAPRLLRPAGLLVICDFFKTERHGDQAAGDRSFGGGHAWRAFNERMRSAPFVLERDEDITARVSPNLELVNQVLQERIRPAADTLRRYFAGRHPVLAWLGAGLFRRKLAKLEYKYFSGHRTKATFERYKTYRLLVYRLR